MSMESAKAFYERMKTDEEFAKKVTACKDTETRMDLIKLEGYDFTPADFVSLNTELSEEELDAVSGGITVFEGALIEFYVGCRQGKKRTT